jgi:hypothetical protein
MIVLAWALSMAGHFLALGVRLGGDSGRYLEGARALLAGQALAGKQLQFWGYEGLVALGLGTGTGEAGVVAAQALLALAAAWLLWRAGSQAFGQAAGCLAALAYLAYPDVQAWNFYLLPDGPFTSLLAICVCLALLAGRRALWWLALAPALFWLALLRPEGALFLLPLAAYFALGRGWGWALLLATGAAALFVLAGGAGAPGREDVLGHWQRGTVVWGAGLAWPSTRLAGAGGEGVSLAGWLGQALLDDPLWVAGLLTRRWFWFLAHARPYYSLAHNAVAGLASLAVLGLAGLALWREGGPGAGRGKALLVLVLLTQAALVGLTWADYDGRCLARVTPVLMLLAAAGLAPARSRWEYLTDS